MKEMLIYLAIFAAIYILTHTWPFTAQYYNKLLSKAAGGKSFTAPDKIK